MPMSRAYAAFDDFDPFQGANFARNLLGGGGNHVMDEREA
jgi:hypothetical protein